MRQAKVAKHEPNGSFLLIVKVSFAPLTEGSHGGRECGGASKVGLSAIQPWLNGAGGRYNNNFAPIWTFEGLVRVPPFFILIFNQRFGLCDDGMVVGVGVGVGWWWW